MRTIIDLTEDDSPGGGPCMPTPCEIGSDGDDVVISLRETELRMSFVQFCAYHEALNRYAFQTAISGRDLIDMDDENHVPAAEHEALRKLVADLFGGIFDGVDVPTALRDRVRWRLAKVANHERWRMQEELIADLRQQIEELTKPRKRRPKEP